MLERLNHPNIIKLHHSRKTTNNLYLFMDYCEEGDLTTFVKTLFNSSELRTFGGKPRVDENQARYIIGHVLHGLVYLIENNIVHRDIKMDNILVKRKQSSREPFLMV